MAITTKFWTWLGLKTKVELDLDLQGEIFITEPELLGYANEAIDEAEAEIHGIYEDYFLARDILTLVLGQDEYSLPANIFAHKIRRITFRNGSKVYTINRLRDWKKFEDYELHRITNADTEYQYFLLNEVAGAPKIVLTPPAIEVGAFVRIWYLRQANRLESDTDIMDIPEAMNFIMQYMKVRCYEKEGHPNLVKAIDDLEFQRKLLQDTLTTMIPDNDNEIEPDYRHYEEMN